MQKIVYINIDGIIAEYASKMVSQMNSIITADRYEYLSFFYELVPPTKGGIESVNYLLNISELNVYFISSPSWNESEEWLEKKEWLGQLFNNKDIDKRLFLCHQKQLLVGDYLIDDSWRHGSKQFEGKWIQIGVDPKFPGWDEVLEFLIKDVKS